MLVAGGDICSRIYLVADFFIEIYVLDTSFTVNYIFLLRFFSSLKTAILLILKYFMWEKAQLSNKININGRKDDERVYNKNSNVKPLTSLSIYLSRVLTIKKYGPMINNRISTKFDVPKPISSCILFFTWSIINQKKYNDIEKT